MRNILFCGKRKDNGEWVEGGYFKEPYTDKVYIICWNSFGLGYNEFIEVDPATVGQFTGLTDKNGKKIFEGDIVRCISMTDMANMVVIFEYGEFRMVLCENYKDYIPGCGFYAIRFFDKEVIGNIHDNPELLENP